MSTELSRYQETYTNSRESLEASRSVVATISFVVNIVTVVTDAIATIEDKAAALDRIAGALDTGLSLASKFGIGPVAKLLRRAVDQVEDWASSVRIHAEDIDDRLDALVFQLTAVAAALEVTEVILADAVFRMDLQAAALSDATRAAEEIDFGAEFTGALGAADAAVGHLNEPARVASIDAAFDSFASDALAVEADMSGFAAPGEALRDTVEPINDVLAKIAFLEGPLDILEDALAPLQWVLDAADFVFDAVVDPILDPILDSLGITELFEEMVQALGLPALSTFTDVLDQLDAIERAIGDATSSPAEALQSKASTLVDDQVDRALLAPVRDNPTNGDDILLMRDELNSFGSSLDGLHGDDLIAGGLGDDTIYGGRGNDILIGGVGDDRLHGGAGHDAAVFLTGFGNVAVSFEQATTDENGDGVVDEDDRLIVLTQNRVESNGSWRGSDTLEGIEEVHFLDASFLASTLQNLRRVTDVSGELLDGTPEPDVILGLGGDDTLLGYDTVAGDVGVNDSDYLDGDSGNDSLVGGGGNDRLVAVADSMSTLDGGKGDDTAIVRGTSSATGASLLGDASRTPFVDSNTYIHVENLSGTGALVRLWGSNHANALTGNRLDNVINGFRGDDSIDGGAGDDTLVGSNGDDTVVGGADRDTFIGGLGNDSYIDDDGTGTLAYGFEELVSPDLLDPVSLGFTARDIGNRLPHHVVFDLPNGRVLKYDARDNLVGTDSVGSLEVAIGTAANDTLIGAIQRQVLYGGAGDDLLVGPDEGVDGIAGGFAMAGGAGNDIYDTGLAGVAVHDTGGDDVLRVDNDGYFNALDEAGIDTIDLSGSSRRWSVDLSGTMRSYDESALFPLGSNGVAYESTAIGYENVIGSNRTDNIFGNERANLLFASLGDDRLSGVDNADGSGDTLIGGEGNNVLIATRGSDLLLGQNGNDSFYAGMTDGGGTDTWEGGAGHDDFTPTTSGVTLIDGGKGTDTLRLNVYSVNGAEVDLQSGIARARGDTGAPDTLISIENADGTPQGDSLFGRVAGSKMRGMLVDDLVTGRGGNDVLYGNNGDDTINGCNGNDLIFPGLGDDVVDGKRGFDTVTFEARQLGDEVPAGSIRAADYEPLLTEGNVTANLLLQIADFEFTGHNPVLNQAAVGSRHVTSLTSIEGVIGTANADRLGGDAGDNVFGAGAGDDLLVGRGRNDSLSGGEGDDVIHGDHRAFAEMNLLRLNDGERTGDHLRLDDVAMPTGPLSIELVVGSERPGIGGQSEIAFLSYSTAASDNEFLVFGQPGGTLDVWIGGTPVDTGVATDLLIDGNLHRLSVILDTDAGRVNIAIDGELVSSTASSAVNSVDTGGTLIIGQEQDSFGGSFESDQIIKGAVGDIRIFDIARSAEEIAADWDAEIRVPARTDGLLANWQVRGNGTVRDALGGPALTGVGTDRDDVVETGRDGDDVLQGGAGNDTLFGGGGDNTLYGGAGSDVYHVDSETDRIIEYRGAGSGNDLVITTVSLRLAGDVERLRLAGEADDRLGANGNRLANDMVGDAGDNLLRGLHGADSIRGRNGDDRLDGNRGDDTVEGGNGDDLVLGSIGDDFLDGGAGEDQLEGARGDDVLRGRAGEDVLLGGRGDDVLLGHGGDDTIDGGAGNDTMTGGGGIDVFTFAGAFGSDTIEGFEAGRDLVSLRRLRDANDGDPLAFDQLLLRGGSDAVLRFDLDRDGVADTLDLDGDGTSDPVQIRFVDVPRGMLAETDFLF